jgi:hypothetical protein
MNGRSSGSGGALVHELLSAARAEAVPQASRERVARKLGIPLAASGAGAAALSALGDGVTLDGVASRRDVVPRVKLNGRLRLDVGWLGIVSALLVGAPAGVAPGDLAPGAVALSDVAVRAQPAPARPAAQASGAVGAGLEPHLAPSALAVPARDESTGAARAIVPRAKRPLTSDRARARGETPAMVARATAAPGTLLEEVHKLDRVRSSLGVGNGAGALAAIEQYERAFAAGELRLEARVLRVAALFAVGDTARARRLARELLVAPGAERYRAELGRLLEKQR